MSRQTRAEWEAGIEAIHREAEGVLEMDTVLITDVPQLIGLGIIGNMEARRLVDAVTSALGFIQGAPKNKPSLCGCCSAPLPKANFSFVIARPANHSPSPSLALAICSTCGTTRTEVMAAGVRALMDLWGEGRAITVTHEGGHA